MPNKSSAVNILSLILILATRNGLGEDQRIVPSLTVRVDTTQLEIRQLFHLFENYVNSRPDSLYDNPYWSERDKSRYPGPYFAQSWIYPNQDILYSFSPKALSIEREEDYYVIRVLYYREGLEEAYRGSNPWAIQRLYAAKENGEWRLFDPLYITTASWPRKQVGPLLYIHHPEHIFQAAQAERQADFVDSVEKALALPKIDAIEFYLTNQVDELARIAGLDFILGTTTGRSHAANRQVLSALGSEWYPHEIAHIVFRNYRASYLLNEGIATLLGGTMGIPFDTLVRELATYLEENDTISFQYMLDHPFQAGSTRHFYTTGAVICKVALEKGGEKALKELLSSGQNQIELYYALLKTLGWPKEKMTELWRKKTLEYAGR